MKPRLSTIFVLALSALVISCGGAKKAAPITVNELEPYANASMKFGIKAPKGWSKSDGGKEVWFFSSPDIVQRFTTYDADGASGARVSIGAKKMEGKDLATMIAEDPKVFEAKMYGAPTPVTIGGVQGMKIAYEFELGDGKFKGEKYFATKDNAVLTWVDFEAFGGNFDNLKPKFDEMLASVALGEEVKKDAAPAQAAEPEVFKPAETSSPRKGMGFSINIPDNFNAAPLKTPGTLSSTKFSGSGGPKDCTIQVDVLDASKQKNLDKIVNDNKGAYKASASVGASLGGEKAAYLEGSLAANTKTRAYFAIKGDKLYRVTLNWFLPEESIFKPVFEKAVGTFKFE